MDNSKWQECENKIVSRGKTFYKPLNSACAELLVTFSKTTSKNLLILIKSFFTSLQSFYVITCKISIFKMMNGVHIFHLKSRKPHNFIWKCYTKHERYSWKLFWKDDWNLNFINFIGILCDRECFKTMFQHFLKN